MQFTQDFATAQDQQDRLAHFRDKFHIPFHNDQPAFYFTGNSLGLQPKNARKFIEEELEDWARYGVDGHLESRRPWKDYHEFFAKPLAKIVGAKPDEVVAMNGLTTNLHLLMVSFFRPDGKKTKILCEGKAFPSDRYALRSQLRFHGLDPDEHLIEIEPDSETELIEDERFVEAIEKHKDELALVMIGGVNYYTGQFFDIEKITKKAREHNITIGWDLAHGAGNVPLELHKWGVDFAAWCGYKYLNGGPGGVSGVFIHEKYHGKKDLPRFEGWWGHEKNSRFKMPKDFVPINSAEAWQLSNAPVFSMAPLLASLEIFEEAGMSALREKSEKLTAFLEFVLHEIKNEFSNIKILTPSKKERRGCQISVVVPGLGKSLFDQLTEQGVVADWREPDVIRLAPVPLYNTFSDVFHFGKILEKTLREK